MAEFFFELNLSKAEHLPFNSRKIFQRAFGAWSAEISLRFRFVTKNPQIKIQFVYGDHGDNNPFDGKGTPLTTFGSKKLNYQSL